MIVSTCVALLLGQTTLVLKGFDPIELAAGREVAGKTSLSHSYLRYQYRFASGENMNLFKSDPERFGVMFGGACGKMGPLTGKGSPDRWAVANGNVILFASDGCRDTFLANKDAYFKPVPDLPATNATELEAAKALYRRMVLAHGGETVLKMSGAQWCFKTPYKEGGKDKVWLEFEAIAGEGKYAMWSEWDAGINFFVIDGERSLEGEPDETFDVHSAERLQVKSNLLRSPFGVLLAGDRSARKVLAEERFEDVACDVLALGQDGLFTEVLIAKDTGLLQGIRYTGRFSGPIRRVEVSYSNPVTIDGITVPTTGKTKLDSGEWRKSRTMEMLAINPATPKPFGLAFK